MNLADFLNYYSAQVLDSAFIMSHFVNLDSKFMQEKIIICVGVEYIVCDLHVSQLCVFVAVYRVGREGITCSVPRLPNGKERAPVLCPVSVSVQHYSITVIS